MKRELDGAREQGAISPSSVEDEPGTLVGSAGTPRGGGPRARGSKGRLSSPTSEPFREGERRGREGAPSTCAHDQVRWGSQSLAKSRAFEHSDLVAARGRGA